MRPTCCAATLFTIFHPATHRATTPQNGATVLHWAQFVPLLLIAKLIAKGADINAKEAEVSSPPPFTLPCPLRCRTIMRKLSQPHLCRHLIASSLSTHAHAQAGATDPTRTRRCLHALIVIPRPTAKPRGGARACGSSPILTCAAIA
jgi:hypothetical protein